MLSKIIGVIFSVLKRIFMCTFLCTTLAFSGSAYSFFRDCCPFFEAFCPYGGVDFQQIWMKGNANWNILFPHRHPGFDVFLGSRFNENWAVEVGLDWARKSSLSTVINPGRYNGLILTETHYVNTKVQRNGVHFDIVGILPMWECWDVIATAGIGFIKPNVHVIDATDGESVSDNLLQSALISTSSPTRGVWRLRFGMSYMFNDCVGIRGLLGGDGGKWLHIKGNFAAQTLEFDKKGFQNAFLLSLGAFVYF